jgi:hypothetical protein
VSTLGGAPFVREEGGTLVASWWKVEFLIPESFFQDPPLAEDDGGSVETLMFLTVRATEKPDSRPRLFAVSLPARLRILYSASGEEADGEGETVRVFSASEGEVVAGSVEIIQSFDNVLGLFRVLASARVTNVGYEELASLFIDGSALNGSNAGATRSMLEAMVSEMARWKKDESVPLRIPMAAGKAGPTDFRFAKLKDLPRLNGVFTGVGFEDIQLAVQSGVRKTMRGEPQRVSPVEEVLKY